MTRYSTLPAVFSVALLACTARAQDSASDPLHKVNKVDGFRDLYLTGDYYLGGQPTLETLNWLKRQGVTLIVNVRSDEENKEFTATAFDEGNVVDDLGMVYSSLPLNDRKSYNPTTLQSFAEIIDRNRGKALIHCLGGGRVMYLWMAYLVKYRGFSIDEAVQVGRQMRFSFPLEDYLGVRMSMTAVEPPPQ